jgi:hypothetical protein
LIDSKRLPIVPVDSSAARIPLPGATIAFAYEKRGDCRERERIKGVRQ